MGWFSIGGTGKKSSSTSDDSQTIGITSDVSGEGASANATTLGDIEDFVGNLQIQTTDFGALDAARDIADKSFAFSGSSFDSAVQAVGKSTDTLAKVAQSAQETARSAAQSDVTEAVKYIAIAAAVAVVGYSLFKGR